MRRYGGPTRLDRAIALLKSAAVGRPFVLVVERAHPDADREAMTIYPGANQAGWMTVGLLETAVSREKSRYAAANQTPDDSEA